MVASNIVYFYPYLGKISNLMCIFFKWGGSTTNLAKQFDNHYIPKIHIGKFGEFAEPLVFCSQKKMKLGTTFFVPRFWLQEANIFQKHAKRKAPKIPFLQGSVWNSSPNHNPTKPSNCIQEHWQTARTDDVRGQVEGFFVCEVGQVNCEVPIFVIFEWGIQPR